MSNLTIALIGVGVLLVLLVAGMNIGISMMAVGFFGYAFVKSFKSAGILFQTIPFTQASSYALTVLPLFVLMGQLCFHSGMSTDLYDCAHKWLGGMRGGLASATVAACACFAAICGSTAATASTMGVVALPEMREHGYDDGLSCGSIAAGGTLGILIPPSGGFIVFGIVAGESIGALFAAGIVPGILLAICYILAIVITVRIRPEKAPGKMHFTWKEKLISLKGAAAMLIIFIIAIGGIFGGLFTANEAAAVGASCALIYLIICRKFSFKVLIASLRETLKTSGMIFMILIGAYIFGSFLSITKLPTILATFISGLHVSKYLILLVILIMYAIMGCFMDSMAMVMLTVPIFHPIMVGLGFDSVWYGVLMIMVMEMGLITPPVGMNVYIVAGVAKDVPLQKIFAGVAPMVAAMCVAIVLVCVFPQIALWLPHVLGY